MFYPFEPCCPPTQKRKPATLAERVADLASNQSVQDRLKKRGMACQRVAWEDTSRYEGSCWGSNISDMTLKVDTTRMPIIRAPNFTDTTVDLKSDQLPMLVVGNETGTGLTKVTLKEYLENFHKYCGTKSRDELNLYNKRDEHVLTSAQACVLPAETGKVEFAVDLYNYQSGSEPAVLVIMATSYGTSAQVVCGGNTVLYFNDNGTSRLFKAERLTQYRAAQGKPKEGAMTSEEKSLNGIYIFQVPLKVERRHRPMVYLESVGGGCYDEMDDGDFGGPECVSYPKAYAACASLGMERAILTLGDEKGPFKGIKKNDSENHKLIRDTDRPVRLTVQFYMCSDTDDIADHNVEDICNQIRHIYDKGCNEGSLVVNTPVPKPGLPTEPQPKRPTTTGPQNPPPHLNNNIL